MTNGLTLLVHEDRSTPMVSVNVLYGVGARDEEPTRTGFAHLFEHLMFGGTRRVPDYDAVVSGVGGESNAFTNNDITNFYLTVPARKLETALWLESDRMRELDFSQRRLEVQQSVVTEEYNYRYMNQPYGDKWLLLRPLCYKVHPYRWCTIGADIRHVQEATLADVETFFYRYYRPANAILSVAGDVRTDEVVRLVEKWFGDIEAGQRAVHLLPQEPEQTAARTLEVEREVPSDALYVGYVTGGRCDAAFRATDLVSDVLGSGHSSRLYNGLVKGRELFTDIDVYVTGEQDGGLFVVDGQLKEGVGHEEAHRHRARRAAGAGEGAEPLRDDVCLLAIQSAGPRDGAVLLRMDGPPGVDQRGAAALPEGEPGGGPHGGGAPVPSRTPLGTVLQKKIIHIIENNDGQEP